uniref:Deltamethrin resistance protein prag01 domain-containing protein n=1 Tax=Timema bartmani TaxID=61472 RepID=A0A7R9EPQ0_9NEOP|nr:unnamed protein product [Timema bartmani]
MLTRTIRPVIRNILALNGGSLSQVRLYHPPAHQKEPTMDELPVPQGSWKADYDAKQTGYNLQLLAGVAFFSITLGVFTIFFFSSSSSTLDVSGSAGRLAQTLPVLISPSFYLNHVSPVHSFILHVLLRMICGVPVLKTDIIDFNYSVPELKSE